MSNITFEETIQGKTQNPLYIYLAAHARNNFRKMCRTRNKRSRNNELSLKLGEHASLITTCTKKGNWQASRR